LSNNLVGKILPHFKNTPCISYWRTAYKLLITFQYYFFLSINYLKAEYSLRETVSPQGREGRGFDSNPRRNLKKKKEEAIFCLVIRKSR
jgi:hypothetical protein